MPDYSDLTDGNIFVDYAKMDNAADDLVAQTQAIERTLQSLEGELNALQNSWQGVDRDFYDRKKMQWHEAVLNMENILRSHAALLNEISDSYRLSEKSLGQRWAEIPIGR